MKIISHRGFWKSDSEKNTLIAFKRSFDHGFGIETDLRDFNGNIVVSHDIPGPTSLSIDNFFKLYSKYKDLILALNIKSDGLQDLLNEKLIEYGISNYFVFDMSVPDLINYSNKNITFFTRVSEFEKDLPMFEKSNGIWLDSFNENWFSAKKIKEFIDMNKKVAIVSSELHGRSKTKLWSILKKSKLNMSEKLILCTDYPDEAISFFN